jgi:enamine deaminase RidA (YjgF/YER057c/UK114 family)
MTRKISLIHSTNLAQVDYAYASRVPAEMDLLFLAGACPLTKDGLVPNASNIELQSKLCVENLKVALGECGATLSDVVYTRILVATQKQSDLVTA